MSSRNVKVRGTHTLSLRLILHDVQNDAETLRLYPYGQVELVEISERKPQTVHCVERIVTVWSEFSKLTHRVFSA